MRKLKKKTFKYLLSKPQIWKSNVVISRTDYVEQKCESHGQHAYYSSFNQSYIFIFVTLSQLLPSLFFLYRPNDFLSMAALKGGPIRAHYVPYVRYNCT